MWIIAVRLTEHFAVRVIWKSVKKEPENFHKAKKVDPEFRLLALDHNLKKKIAA